MSLLLSIIVFGIAFASLVDTPKRKSQAEYRREKQFWKSQRALERYEALPPMVRMFDAEMRERKNLKRAMRAVSWAIVAEDFSQKEADGAILVALRRDKTLGQDSTRLYDAALSIVRQATCQ